MKRCASCDRVLAEKVTTCPACGSRQSEGLTHIDGHRIMAIIHEGRSSLVCKAVKEEGGAPVSIRLFTDDSGVDETVAQRLARELNELGRLPADHFVRHFAIKRTPNGQYYRISEWVNADNWGAVFMSGILNDQRNLAVLFRNIAHALDILHRHDHFMPYLILDDILIPRDRAQDLAVKINYKLSRFLNARATHHGPMLKKLLDCHPDIRNSRAIDFRSGIWSLGKIFVELLTTNPNVTDFSSQIDKLPGINTELAVLIKVMLSEDPDLRPQSMAKVMAALDDILARLEKEPPPKSVYKRRPKLLRELNLWKRTAVLLMAMTMALAALLIVFRFQEDRIKGEAEFNGFVESYADAIGFLMVEYWLRDPENRVVYKNNVEGTAFLVDTDGYLLTNRHVACPWLEDPSLFRVYHQYRMLERPLEMGHRMFFWFEGEKAFNRLPDLKHSEELSDAYYLPSAFRSDTKQNLRIAGVPRSSDATGEMVRSPFKHDFAVLKIDNPPPELTPLPLEAGLDPMDIQRLSSVIILGFPLGNRTQDDHVNASITRGHVRRTSSEIIQVDSSIYKGNSGGPAVDGAGRVIGIASGVVTDQASSMFPINTPLSDFGLVLPISEPARFVSRLKAGAPKWNGLLDFTLEAKLEEISDLAMGHDYKAAAQLADALLTNGNEPSLLFASGIFHFCTRSYGKSRHRFRQLISVEGRNATAALMLYIMDWMTAQDRDADLTAPLFRMTWQDREEFTGYLASVLKTGKLMQTGFRDFENRAEHAWRSFIDGLILETSGRPETAADRFKQGVLWAGAGDYLYFLSFSRLTVAGIGDDLADSAKDFRGRALENRKQVKLTHEKISGLINEFENAETDYDDKLDTYEELRELMPENHTIDGRMAFFHAMHGEWDTAMGFIKAFFSGPVRETSLSLSLGLLQGEILHIQGKARAARDHLGRFRISTRDPWYAAICKYLTLGGKETNLLAAAGTSPEKLITLHTALGLWAEGNQDLEKAAHHYREALSTYLDGWNEYDLALNRIMALRRAPD